MLYMAVTSDEYELPCCVSDTGKKLAEIYGIHEPYLWLLMQQGKPYKKCGVKFVRVKE